MMGKALIWIVKKSSKYFILGNESFIKKIKKNELSDIDLLNRENSNSKKLELENLVQKIYEKSKLKKRGLNGEINQLNYNLATKLIDEWINYKDKLYNAQQDKNPRIELINDTKKLFHHYINNVQSIIINQFIERNYETDEEEKIVLKSELLKITEEYLIKPIKKKQLKIQIKEKISENIDYKELSNLVEMIHETKYMKLTAKLFSETLHCTYKQGPIIQYIQVKSDIGIYALLKEIYGNNFNQEQNKILHAIHTLYSTNRQIIDEKNSKGNIVTYLQISKKLEREKVIFIPGEHVPMYGIKQEGINYKIINMKNGEKNGK
jgi:hypothetical protein